MTTPRESVEEVSGAERGKANCTVGAGDRGGGNGGEIKRWK